MIKKIGTVCVFLCVFLMGFSGVTASNNCKISTGATIKDNLKNCMGDTSLVNTDDAKVGEGFKKVINGWTNNIALFLGILAVGSVVYGGLMMTLSTGDDEKIKKAKDIVKWGLLGLLAVVLAATVVTLVINIMYSFSG
ncbi:MAG: hypothetical protein GY828_06295 [Candidatus Gracilibacteria bacterium]|nr:hypothetical protein [Candidatus Gracilibacteria bacterium]